MNKYFKCLILIKILLFVLLVQQRYKLILLFNILRRNKKKMNVTKFIQNILII